MGSVSKPCEVSGSDVCIIHLCLLDDTWDVKGWLAEIVLLFNLNKTLAPGPFVFSWSLSPQSLSSNVTPFSSLEPLTHISDVVLVTPVIYLGLFILSCLPAWGERWCWVMQFSTFWHPPRAPSSQALMCLQDHWIRARLPLLHTAYCGCMATNTLAPCIPSRGDATVGSIRGKVGGLEVPVNFLAWETQSRAHPTASVDDVSLHGSRGWQSSSVPSNASCTSNFKIFY